MADILKDSFFVRIFLFLYQKFYLYKETSVFIGLLNKIRKYYRYSGTKRILRSYVHQKEYYKYSVTFRIIDGISRRLSYLCYVLHKFFGKLFEGSVIFCKINSLDEVPAEIIFVYMACFIAAVDVIYLVLCLVFYDFERINIVPSAVIAACALLCLCLGNLWKYIRNSLLYRTIRYFFEE